MKRVHPSHEACSRLPGAGTRTDKQDGNKPVASRLAFFIAGTLEKRDFRV